jgi:hypothetical protein
MKFGIKRSEGGQGRLGRLGGGKSIYEKKVFLYVKAAKKEGKN